MSCYADRGDAHVAKKGPASHDDEPFKADSADVPLDCRSNLSILLKYSTYSIAPPKEPGRLPSLFTIRKYLSSIWTGYERIIADEIIAFTTLISIAIVWIF